MPAPPPFVAAPSFLAAALDSARLLRQLSWNEVAERALLSRAALSNLRNGSQPSAATVAALAEGLDFPAQYFFTPTPSAPNAEVLHYRKKARAPKKRIEQLLAQASVLQQLVETLSSLPRFPSDRLHTPTKVRTNTKGDDEADRGDIESIAEQCRRRWGLAEDEPLVDCCASLEKMGAWLTPFAAEDIAVDAFCWRHQVGRRKLPLIMYRGDSAPSRVRFSLLHEAGHLVLHGHGCSGDVDHEREANWFAGAMLLPRRAMTQNFPLQGQRLDWDGLVTLKQTWGASLQAIVQRAKQLDIIGAATQRWAYVHINQRGWRKHEPGEPDRVETPTLLNRWVERYCLHHQLERKELAAQLYLPPEVIDNLIGDPT